MKPRIFVFLVFIFLLPCTLLVAQTGGAPTISNLTDNRNSYSNEQVPRYEKLEITFGVSSKAEKYFLPYDPAPPGGVEPGIGISADALFTAPDGSTYRQPAFYHQEFEHQVKSGRDWLYPTDNRLWKVRFAPNQAGVWSYRIVVQEAGGTSESESRSVTVAGSSSRGFVRVSEKDPRYFEFEDGTYFPGLGYNMNHNHVSWENPVLENQANFQAMGGNGVQLIRIWLSQWAVYGSAWTPWRSHVKNGYFPNESLTLEDKHPEGDLAFKLDYPDNPCIVWGVGTHTLPVKRNKTYRIQISYKTVGMGVPRYPEQPFGLVAKLSAWAWGKDETERITEPGVGSVVTSHVSTDSNGWQVLEGAFNSGDRDFLDYLYLVLENVSAGSAYIHNISVREELGAEVYGPNIVPKPSPDFHDYIDQRNAHALDQVLDLARVNGIYLRPVVLDKMDWIFRHIDFDGNWIPNDPACWDDDPNNDPDACPKGDDWFYGQGRQEHKTRWLQKAWWRYLQARWGYSPNIHSWEMINEGHPGDTDHWVLADEFGQFMHSEAFGVPVADGEKFRLDHPNDHLVSTSFWIHFPVLFHSNESGEYDNVDFADIHKYISPQDEGFYDLASETSQLSMSLRSLVANKPIVRGEVGMKEAPPELTQSGGVWLHNFIWGSINPGGVIDSYWFENDHIYLKSKSGEYVFDHRSEYGKYYRFISTIPLNNGNYRDAVPEISNSSLRAWGQKDVVNGNAHLWIQNRNHTWKNVALGGAATPESGSVTLRGFQTSQEYLVEWWDTYQGAVSGSERQQANSSGDIVLTVAGLERDIAVKVFKIVNEPQENHPPVADAGPDQTAAPGATVTLSGSGFDPDGDPLTYAWKQTAGVAVSLTGANTPTASFTAPSVPADTWLEFQLTLMDGKPGSSDADRVRVLVDVGGSMTASAGADQYVLSGTTVTLYGARRDPDDGNPVIFEWEQISGPPVTLSGANTATLRFQAPKGLNSAEFVFRLWLLDKDGNRASDDCRVSATKAGDLVFPSTTKGSDPSLENTFVGIAFLNTSLQPNTVDLEAVDKTGAARVLKSSVFPAWSQDAFLTESLPGFTEAPAIRARDQQGGLQGFFMVGDGRPDRLDGVGSLMAPSKSLFLPIAEAGSRDASVLFLSNSQNEVARVDINIVAAGGAVLKSKSLQLAPGSSQLTSLTELTASNPAAGECYVQIASDVPVHGFQLLAGEESFSSAAAQPPIPTSMLWLPHFIFGPKGEDTELRLVNPQGTALEARLKIYDDNATLLTARLLEIPGYGLAVTRLSELLGPEAVPPGSPFLTGHITVEVFTADSMLIGTATFTSTQAKAASVLPFWRQPQNETLYLQVAQSPQEGVFTGLAIMNPDDRSVSVTVEVFDQNGKMTGRKDLVIEAGKRAVDVLDGARWFGPSFRQTKGHMRVRSDRPVVSFVMFGDGQLQFLSAVEGQPVLQ